METAKNTLVIQLVKETGSLNDTILNPHDSKAIQKRHPKATDLEDFQHGKEKEFFKEKEDVTVSEEAKYELQVQDGIDRRSLKDRFHYNGMYWH